MIHLEPEDTKDKERRNIPICDELYEMLVSLPNRIQKTDNDNHVFQFNGKPVGDFRTGLKKACKKAGIKYGRFVKGGFIFHDLRHTFNTNMRKAGVQESVIMEVTGHSTREMFDRYNSIDEDDTRQAVDQMTAFLNSVDHPVDHAGKIEQKKLMNPCRVHLNILFMSLYFFKANKKRAQKESILPNPHYFCGAEGRT